MTSHNAPASKKKENRLTFTYTLLGGAKTVEKMASKKKTSSKRKVSKKAEAKAKVSKQQRKEKKTQSRRKEKKQVFDFLKF